MAAREPDDRTLRQLAAWEDAAGVVSVYADASPERQTGSPPAVELALRASLDRLVAAARASGPRESRALERRLERAASELEALAAPGERGAGRALFLGISDEVSRSFALPEPFADDAWLRARPVLGPLARALDHGRPAGIVDISRTGARIVDWRLGQATELARLSFSDPHREWQPLPPGEHGAHQRNAGPQRDLFQRRAMTEAERGLRAVAGEVARLAPDEGWDQLVVAGEGRLAGELANELATATEAHIAVDARQLQWTSAHELAEALAPLIRDTRTRRSADLVARVRDAAYSHGKGVLGRKATSAALAEGRVEELVLASSASSEDTDELIARAYDTDARVRLVDAEDAEPLTDGVGGLLRW